MSISPISANAVSVPTVQTTVAASVSTPAVSAATTKSSSTVATPPVVVAGKGVRLGGIDTFV